jgi:hypothetical protein
VGCSACLALPAGYRIGGLSVLGGLPLYSVDGTRSVEKETRKSYVDWKWRPGQGPCGHLGGISSCICKNAGMAGMRL